MGAWGYGVLEDDSAADVYSDYMAKFNSGAKPEDIRRELESEYADTLDDVDEGPIFWLALGQAQWETGSLQSDVLVKVTDIVTSHVDGRWEEQGLDELAKRRDALNKYLQVLTSHNPAPLKPTGNAATIPELRDITALKTEGAQSNGAKKPWWKFW